MPKKEAPPYPPPPYSKESTYANMTYYPPMGMGVAANYIPGSSEKPTTNPEGFNVWYIQGGTGFVNMPPNGNPAETLGRLETMRMCLRGNHKYGITKMPKADDDDEDSDNDKKKKPKKKAKAVEEDADDSDEEIPKPPAPPTKPKKLVCNVCHGDKKKETRKVEGDGTICWPCLWYRYKERAEEKWLDAE